MELYLYAPPCAFIKHTNNITLLCRTYTEAVSSSSYAVPNGKIKLKTEFEGMWREAVVAYFDVYSWD